MNTKYLAAIMTITALTTPAYAAGTNNTIGGTDNIATANSAAVFGYQNQTNANNTLTFGENNITNGTNAFAGGNNSKAEGRNTFAFGSHAEALTEYTYAIGSQAKTSAYDTIAVGNGAYAGGESTIVIGRTNTVNGKNSVVIGANNMQVDGGQSTVLGYNNRVDNSQEQTILGANSQTAGQGATVIGTHSKATAVDAMAIGNNTIADKSNSVALGTNSVTDEAVATRQAVVNGVTHVFAGDSPQSVVSVGSKGRAGYGGVQYYTRQITNVAAGQVDPSSTDAINGSQLYAAYDEISNNGVAIQNLVNTTNQHTAAISQHESQLQNHEARITTLEHNTAGQISHVLSEVAKTGAANAALSALHYLGYNADDKLTFAAGYGHYKNANAAAIGAFYAPNEHVLFNIGATLGGTAMINAGVSFRLGKGSEYELNHKGKIAQLEALVNELINEVAELKEAK
ncbi:MAG: YadA-like family protein [Veillonella sp.]|nr:YadA-like family protein [Veillonella sp.]